MQEDAIIPPRPRFRIVLLFVIIAALAGMAVWFVGELCGSHSRSRGDIARASVAAQHSGFSAWSAIRRAYCANPGDTFIPNALQHDPWGTPYLFECNAQSITVVSAGEDGVYMTDDDIRSDR